MKIQINNGRIIDPANNIDESGSICIDNGTILSVLTRPRGFKPDRIIEADNNWICPGIIDLSARFGEPGQEYQATIASESAAAASAGVTAVCCPPDTLPVIDTPAVAELIRQHAEHSGLAHVYPLAALTQGLKGERLAEMHALRQAGCVGVSNANRPVVNNEVLRRSFEYAASTGLTVFIHAEDHNLRNQGVVNEGAVSTRLGLPPIPETAETVAVSTALLLIEQTGVRAHFCQLSTARSVEMIARAKRAGLPVTADVDICHLYLTELDVDGYNSSCHLSPPLRRLEDKQALVAGLVDGVIDAVCSDHQPHDDDAKSAPFGLTRPGASTIEMLLPLMLDLSTRGFMTPAQALGKLTANPASILKLRSGSLTPGNPADIIVIDPGKTWTVDRSKLISAGKITPFEGWELSGKVNYTLLGGKIVYTNPDRPC